MAALLSEGVTGNPDCSTASPDAKSFDSVRDRLAEGARLYVGAGTGTVSARRKRMLFDYWAAFLSFYKKRTLSTDCYDLYHRYLAG